MSRTLNVIKNKNKREREARLKNRQNLEAIKTEAAFRAKLHDDMKCIDVMLQDEEVDTVCVEIPKQHLSNFMRVIYSEEMAQYSINQIDTDKFEIGRKVITF